MNKTSFKLILLTIVSSLSAYAFVTRPSPDALESIRAEDVRRHIDFLASDSLMGRNTPSPGLEIAGEYIADEFQKYGIQPLNGSYFQEFHLKRTHLGEKNSLRLTLPGGVEKAFQLKHDFIPFDFTATARARGELVFAGYGITAPEYDYDDYRNLDVHGKVVLALRHEPGEKDPSSKFEGLQLTRHSLFQSKFKNAVAHGASAILIVTDPVNHRSIRARGFPWPSLYKNIPDNALPLTLSLNEEGGIPAVHVGKRFIAQIFGSVDSLRSLQQRIDTTLEPQSFEIANVRVSLETSTVADLKSARNVVGLWEGSDPVLKNEAIVIGAHYDHIGYKKGPVKPGEDYIFNGADDNASGTTGLLEIAQAFTFSLRPKRSILFVAFAGEEKGLLGSRAYIEQPLWPLEKTKAMLNMDMIGRNEGDRVSIIGYSHSPELNEINIEEDKFIGLKLEYNGERYFTRSDQFNFARHGIPVLFYNTGDHEDYHKVTDNPDKINAGKIAMIARLVFRTAWRAANTDEILHYVEQP
ncbi:MAG: M28 family peptidase [bacterium]